MPRAPFNFKIILSCINCAAVKCGSFKFCFVDMFVV